MTYDTPPAAPFPMLVGTIGALVPTTALVRIFPPARAVTHFYCDEFLRVWVRPDVEREVTRRIKKHFTGIADWRHAHDFHVSTGRLYLTPEPYQRGYVPEDDGTFGTDPQRLVAVAGGAQ
ncbi:hypothetical protein [Streptomyces sp. GS7]|uniref:hypothetical protein n=1 Tax=Streptomyces sp. GS7 TaxID=2692234 RepID=UPI0013193F13|nr:hypothetical protein [Streptomyces sp. GS7]QHC26355.1 hypothetical protein GR130_38305 [Streptomyces sp. GS7]